jgi:predicted transcriptional regulator
MQMDSEKLSQLEKEGIIQRFEVLSVWHYPFIYSLAT